MGVLRHGTIRNRLLMTLSYDVSAKIRGTKGECDLANGGNIKNNAPDHSDRLCDCRQPDAVSASGCSNLYVLQFRYVHSLDLDGIT